MEQQSMQWRRDKVQELNSQGNSQRDIAKILQVGIGTVKTCVNNILVHSYC
jgi:transposase